MMKRKKWTAQTEISTALLKFREKRKWQISLRRYVLMENPCSSYAPYFGLDIKNFRKWIEMQFDGEMNWGNFSKNWQFDHIIPGNYFDFSIENDLRLCWNFINIRTEKVHLNKNRGNRVDVLAAKTYFETLYQHTQYPVAKEMIRKIEEVEVSQIESSRQLEEFIRNNNEYLNTISSFSPSEYDSLNNGADLPRILAERAFLQKLAKL